MALDTQSDALGDWLKWEEDNLYSREKIILIAGNGDLVTGTVLGKITASGKFTQFDDEATDGSEDAAGILLLDTSVEDDEDKEAVAITKEAIVREGGLTWPSTTDTDENAAAVIDLEALCIRVREGA